MRNKKADTQQAKALNNKKIFNKRFIYGGGSVVMILIFIAALVVVNLIAESVVNLFPSLRVDLTEQKLFELSDETKDVLRELQSDITVYIIAEGGNVPSDVRNTLDSYALYTDRLQIQVVDPLANPKLIQRYDSAEKPLDNGSVVFEHGENFTVVKRGELYPYNSMTQQNDYSVAEARYTSAILSCQLQQKIKIGFVAGHNEPEPQDYMSLLRAENYIVEPVNLLTDDAQDYDVLVIVSPQADFIAQEIDVLDDFLNQAKLLQIYLDAMSNELPQLEGYLREWGMAFDDNILIEGDASRIFSGYPYNIIATLQAHDITNALIAGNSRVFTPLARSVDLSYSGKSGASTTPVLTTSAKAYAKTSDDISTPEQLDTDKSGVMNICAVSYKIIDALTHDNVFYYGRVAAFGTSYMLDASLINYNKDFLLNSIAWGTPGDVSVNVRPKSLEMGRLTITQAQFNVWTVVFLVLLPLAAISCGVVMWLRRRHL